MNEKIIEQPEPNSENSLMLIPQEELSFEEIGHIRFEGLSKLKSSLLGGYNKESVLDIIDKIIEQSENQLANMKRYANTREKRNAMLDHQNDSLREEIYRLMRQIKEDQEDFASRFALKEEQIQLLQNENRQLREKIVRDKELLLERMERQLGPREVAEKLPQPNTAPPVAKKEPEAVGAKEAEKKVPDLPEIEKLPNGESGGDKNWDLDLILKECGEF